MHCCFSGIYLEILELRIGTANLGIGLFHINIGQKAYFRVPKTGATSTSEICGTKNPLA